MARLCSVDELKTLLRIPAAETALDAQLATIIEEVSADCERVTSRTFTETTHTDEQHAGGCDVIVLKNRPVNTTPAVVVEEVDTNAGVSVRDASDYIVDYAHGIIRLRAGHKFTDGPKGTVLVTYKAGYASSGTGTAQKLSVPADLARSVKDVAAARFHKDRSAITAEELEKLELKARRVWAVYGS